MKKLNKPAWINAYIPYGRDGNQSLAPKTTIDMLQRYLGYR